MTTPVFTLAYQSIPTWILTAEALFEVLAKARRFNAAHDISGLVVVGTGRIIQFLEGPEADVRALYARIARDHRHTAVTLLASGPAPQREFPDWSMAYATAAPEPDTGSSELDLTRLEFMLGREDGVFILSPATRALLTTWLAGQPVAPLPLG